MTLSNSLTKVRSLEQNSKTLGLAGCWMGARRAESKGSIWHSPKYSISRRPGSQSLTLGVKCGR